MQDDVAPSQDGAGPFNLREAAAALGISLNTLRRRIAAGQIQAERVHRPQGHVWQVYLHGAPTQQHRADDTVQQDGAGTVQQPPQVPAAIMQAEAMAAYNAQLLSPLVAVIERQADQLVQQAEAIGRLTAERDAAVAAQTKQEAQPAPGPSPAPVESPTPLWRGRWSLVLAIVAVVLLLFVLVLAWPR